mmetsp:Transcript_23675/g.40281  ORF Transcript_23675/g.40281 Transcript_23675/m.40281 type:complete len:87 (+) Transcript_23675:614-874(+)
MNPLKGEVMSFPGDDVRAALNLSLSRSLALTPQRTTCSVILRVVDIAPRLPGDPQHHHQGGAALSVAPQHGREGQERPKIPTNDLL